MMKHITAVTIAAVVALALSAIAAETKAPEKMTTVEIMAMEGILTQDQAMNARKQEFAAEVCKAHGLQVGECNIDAATKTVSKVKPPEPPKPEAKEKQK